MHWLRPVPPIDNGKAQLRIVDPDTLDIVVAGGRQRPGAKETRAGGGLQIRGGRMRITGIMQPHQIGVIDADISGSVPEAIALLREPRLGLLDRHPIDLKDPAGQASVKLAVTVPLEAKVTMNDVAIRAQAHLDGVHLAAIVAGRDLDQGVFDLDANPDGLKLNGQASVAAIPLRRRRDDGFPCRSADTGGADDNRVGAAEFRPACRGGIERDVGAERSHANERDVHRTPQRFQRSRGHGRSDRRGADDCAAGVAQAARHRGQGERPAGAGS